MHRPSRLCGPPPSKLGGGTFRAAIIAVAIGVTAPAAANAADTSPRLGQNDGRFAGISRQSTDATCGPAAVSTLLISWLGDSTATEAELLRVWRGLPQAKGYTTEDGF